VKKAFLLCVLVLGLALLSQAAPVMYIEETFASGGVFSGQVTFLDDYSNLTAVDGWLTGGGYGDDHISWVWNPTYNYASSFGPQYGGNYLMDGTTCGNGCGSYLWFIAITWDFSNPNRLVFANPGGVLASEGGNNVYYDDPMVSGSISMVPEPATFGLLGAGLLGLGLLRRRR
jgi:hypothetical protein